VHLQVLCITSQRQAAKTVEFVLLAHWIATASFSSWCCWTAIHLFTPYQYAGSGREQHTQVTLKSNLCKPDK